MGTPTPLALGPVGGAALSFAGIRGRLSLALKHGRPTASVQRPAIPVAREVALCGRCEVDPRRGTTTVRR